MYYSKICKILLKTYLLICFLWSCISIQNQPTTTGEPLQLIINKCVQFDKEELFHGGILVAKGDSVVFCDAFGKSHSSIENTPQSRFNIASIGKMFTGVAVVQLFERGHLKFDDTIADFLPEFQNEKAAQKITIHQLLTHTSGIPDLLAIKSLKNVDFKDYKEHSSLLRVVERVKVKQNLRQKFMYSNSGYLILGSIIEKITNMTYEEYIRENIYKPAMMNSTSGGLSFGGQSSTLGDLLNFSIALKNHTLLSKQHTTLATTGKVETEPLVFYGYGFFDSSRAKSREVSHTGGAPLVHCQLQMFFETDYVVILYTNQPDRGFQAYQEIRQMTRDKLS